MLEFLSIDPHIGATLLALGLGSVIGLEREIVQQRSGSLSFGGIRTFAFIAMLGALAGIIGETSSLFLTVTGFIGIILLIGISYYSDRTYHKGRTGITSEVVALLTFMVGLLTALDMTLLAVITTVLIITVLALRAYLHKFARELESEEIFASIKFAIIAFIILPLLPNQAFDPWGVLNPYNIWLIIVLISGLNFVGYILNKVFGARKGMALTGFFGGIVSSTAVNLSLADESRISRVPLKALLLALLLAQASSFMLTGVELFIFNKTLFFNMIAPLSMSIILLLGFAFYHFKTCSKKHIRPKKKVEMKSPFTLSQALIFGGVFTTVILLIQILSDYIGNTGLFITSMFSGLISLDAITVSIAQIAGISVDMDTATQVLLVGIIMSIVQKIGVLIIFAKKKYMRTAILHLLIPIAIFAGFALLV